MLQPIGDLILVERLEKEKTTKSGIILPVPNQKSLGRVVSVGKGILNKHTGKFYNYGIEEGDIVIFQTHRGHSAIVNENEYLLLGMRNVLCLYKKKDLIEGEMDIHIDVNETVSGLK